MSICRTLVALLFAWLALHNPATEANPLQKREAHASYDVYDWFSSLFEDEDSDSSEYLICTNCTVVVGQQSTAAPTAAAETSAATTAAAPTAAAPTAAAPTGAAPEATSEAAPPAPPGQ
ncbi:uncharacterized protein LOC132786999 [Drosophila nasuta]|uniref:uncharacterized protein LOC132786999 n=1 Tax=Drosophila nasuta TaxID=42062 RepID=UPI00295E3DD6|nr:uncharacterized protein LOC132786999 [Drosophila nasuta]